MAQYFYTLGYNSQTADIMAGGHADRPRDNDNNIIYDTEPGPVLAGLPTSYAKSRFDNDWDTANNYFAYDIGQLTGEQDILFKSRIISSTGSSYRSSLTTLSNPTTPGSLGTSNVSGGGIWVRYFPNLDYGLTAAKPSANIPWGGVGSDSGIGYLVAFASPANSNTFSSTNSAYRAISLAVKDTWITSGAPSIDDSARLLAGPVVALGTEATITTYQNKSRFLRVNLNGNVLRARAWWDGATEPTSWAINYAPSSPFLSATNYPHGYVGFMCPFGGHAYYLDFFSVGTAGDSAPSTYPGGNRTITGTLRLADGSRSGAGNRVRLYLRTNRQLMAETQTNATGQYTFSIPLAEKDQMFIIGTDTVNNSQNADIQDFVVGTAP